MDKETKDYIDSKLKDQLHDGNYAQRVNFFDLFGYTEPVFIQGATIATTSTSDTYFIAPRNLVLTEAYFSGTDALASSDTNYITWSITNLGQAGAGTAAMLLVSDLNTTKTTGGVAITANSKRTLVVSTTPLNVQVNQGDRIRIRATATGTLANTVTFPVYQLIFS